MVFHENVLEAFPQDRFQGRFIVPGNLEVVRQDTQDAFSGETSLPSRRHDRPGPLPAPFVSLPEFLERVVPRFLFRQFPLEGRQLFTELLQGPLLRPQALLGRLHLFPKGIESPLPFFQVCCPKAGLFPDFRQPPFQLFELPGLPGPPAFQVLEGPRQVLQAVFEPPHLRHFLEMTGFDLLLFRRRRLIAAAQVGDVLLRFQKFRFFLRDGSLELREKLPALADLLRRFIPAVLEIRQGMLPFPFSLFQVPYFSGGELDALFPGPYLVCQPENAFLEPEQVFLHFQEFPAALFQGGLPGAEAALQGAEPVGDVLLPAEKKVLSLQDPGKGLAGEGHVPGFHFFPEPPIFLDPLHLFHDLVEPGPDLGKDILQPGHVLGGGLQFPGGCLAPALVLDDPRRFFDEFPDVLRLRLDKPRNAFLLHDGVGPHADA